MSSLLVNAAFMPIPGAEKYETRAQLKRIIRETMTALGDNCDLNHLDVSGMTDFRSVFQNLPFTGNISKWDVSSATSMHKMFEGSAFDGDISGWNVAKVANMQEMFNRSKFNGDLSKWDVSGATNMTEMFADAYFTGDISQWDVRGVRSFTRMFQGSDFSGDLSAWRPNKDAAMVAVLDEAQLARMAPTIFHWHMAQEFREKLSPIQREHWDKLSPISIGMGMSPQETASWLQGQWVEKSAPGLIYKLPDLELG